MFCGLQLIWLRKDEQTSAEWTGQPLLDIFES